MNRTRTIIALGLASLGLAGIGQAYAGAGPVDVAHVTSEGTRAKIYGCTMEDSCTIDYRGSRRGGVWVIKRVNP
jgi:hypothetical protein